jgi:hypothetical protein
VDHRDNQNHEKQEEFLILKLFEERI